MNHFLIRYIVSNLDFFLQEICYSVNFMAQEDINHSK